MSSDFQHNLGDLVRDKVSGLTGIIISRAEHLYGCARYWVAPQEHKDGKPCEGAWFDEEALDVVEALAVQAPRYVRTAVYVEPAPLRRAGGPVNQPASHVGISDR